MKRVINSNPRSREYDEYLDMHIGGVNRSWLEILRPAVLKKWPNLLSNISVDEIDYIISCHDSSKYSADEYCSYCNYFYPCDGFEANDDDFDRAWLLHQHRNPHHHQHWVLMRDSGEKQPIDMPIEYILEMLCDWHSFTLRDPESTAYKWWNDNKSKMVLSDNTIDIIESLIRYLKDPLVNEGDSN